MDNKIFLEKLNKDEALKYLGYRGHSADERTMELLNECEQKILEVASPKILYRCFDINALENGVEVLNTNLFLPGNAIKEHLKGCDKAIFLCVTIGSDIDKLIRVYEVDDMATMVVLDSLSSVAVEQICDKAENNIASEFKEWYLTFRFGIGYGDLPLELQQNFIKVLDATKKIGVCATKSSLLTPRKSVTCIIGLSKNPIEKKKRGCVTCNMKDRCPYRGTDNSCANS